MRKIESPQILTSIRIILGLIILAYLIYSIVLTFKTPTCSPDSLPIMYCIGGYVGFILMTLLGLGILFWFLRFLFTGEYKID